MMECIVESMDIWIYMNVCMSLVVAVAFVACLCVLCFFASLSSALFLCLPFKYYYLLLLL